MTSSPPIRQGFQPTDLPNDERGGSKLRFTRDAPEHRLALTGFRRAVPADRTGLRGVRGFDLFHPTWSLVFQARDEQAPPIAENGAVQSGLLRDAATGVVSGSSRRAGHRTDSEVLYPNHIELAGEPGAGVLCPVLPAIDLPRREPRDRSLHPCPAVGATTAAGQLLLQPPQPLGFLWTKARAVEQLTGRESRRHRHASVYTNHLAGTWRWHRRRSAGERDVPSPGLDGNLPEPLVPPGLTPRRTAVRPTEEVPHRLSEVAQRLLLHGLTARTKPRELGTSLGQLATLLAVARCGLSARLPARVLLHCEVPHVAGVSAMLQQYDLLVRGGTKPISRHGPQNSRPRRQFRLLSRLDLQKSASSRLQCRDLRRLDFV